jgi:bacillithiol biosynthesis deacetylase BshB1
MQPVDILAIAPHRDDAELNCGGTLIASARLGQRTAIIDLTQGEMGTRGSAALRALEAENASAVMGLAARENLGLPDAGITNTLENRAKLARLIRTLRPQVVIIPATIGRHPDHRVASELARDACFIAGLAKIEPDLPPYRPRKLVHTIAFREDYQKPTFVVDVSDAFEAKLEAVRCYGSQFDEAIQAGEVYPNGEPLYDLIRHHAAHYGSSIRARYGEPFYTHETMKVSDLLSLDVATF